MVRFVIDVFCFGKYLMVVKVFVDDLMWCCEKGIIIVNENWNEVINLVFFFFCGYCVKYLVVCGIFIR